MTSKVQPDFYFEFYLMFKLCAECMAVSCEETAMHSAHVNNYYCIPAPTA